MDEHIDQLGRIVTMKPNLKRIVSLVPSQTELLFDLGLSDELVGLTKFCIHPEEWFRTKQRIGGTKTVDEKLIKHINPDLIIANKEENTKEMLRALEKDFPVWISDVKTLEDALEMINLLGAILDKKEKGQILIKNIKEAFNQLEFFQNQFLEKTVAYFIWRDPWMLAATDTFIHEMLKKCGLRNVFEHLSRYPVCDLDTLKELKPDFIFLSSEPFPFKEKHIQELKTVCPDSKICLVDGEYFSWYGSRLVSAASYFEQLLKQLYHEL